MIHTRPWPKGKGPLFDPEKLKTGGGRRELTALAARYYKSLMTPSGVTTATI